MSQQEQDSLIATALRERTEAKRKMKMITDRLRAAGSRLVDIGHALNPEKGEPANSALESNLRTLSSEMQEIVSVEKLQAMITERNEMLEIIESRTAKLHGYGAE